MELVASLTNSGKAKEKGSTPARPYFRELHSDAGGTIAEGNQDFSSIYAAEIHQRKYSATTIVIAGMTAAWLAAYITSPLQYLDGSQCPGQDFRALSCIEKKLWKPPTEETSFRVLTEEIAEIGGDFVCRTALKNGEPSLALPSQKREFGTLELCFTSFVSQCSPQVREVLSHASLTESHRIMRNLAEGKKKSGILRSGMSQRGGSL